MKLPNWFKVLWWILLLSVLTYFLYQRYSDLTAGNASYADILVFLVWVSLFLLPLFQEISLFGLTLRQEMESLKNDVQGTMNQLRAEIRNSIDVRNQVSPNFTLYPPPPDSRLPEIEESIRKVLNEYVRPHQESILEKKPTELNVDQDVTTLFTARYNIEKELRRISRERVADEEERRPLPIHQLTRVLVEQELIDPSLARAIKEVYAVASPAIHGEDVSDAKLAFVKDVAPDLITALRAI
jgi:hypothetical protein